MDAQELKRIVAEHNSWVRCRLDGGKAILYREDLHGANLYGVNLRTANLCEANLSRADMRQMDLHGANLSEADLRMATLCEANLTRADLTGADMREADLHRANLGGAYLRGANLWECEYDLLGILRIDMGALSADLTLELMRWDALYCGTEAMDDWARGGDCPFEGTKTRPFIFHESQGLWPIGRKNRPKMNIAQLWVAVAEELGIEI